jgi:hypothetical protein
MHAYTARSPHSPNARVRAISERAPRQLVVGEIARVAAAQRCACVRRKCQRERAHIVAK